MRAARIKGGFQEILYNLYNPLYSFLGLNSLINKAKPAAVIQYTLFRSIDIFLDIFIHVA